jgi:hypothetical protein
MCACFSLKNWRRASFCSARARVCWRRSQCLASSGKGPSRAARPTARAAPGASAAAWAWRSTTNPTSDGCPSPPPACCPSCRAQTRGHDQKLIYLYITCCWFHGPDTKRVFVGGSHPNPRDESRTHTLHNIQLVTRREEVFCISAQRSREKNIRRHTIYF